MKKFLFWLPRMLSIFFILFISVFALDVIGQPQWVLALLIHMIPSYFLIAITVVAWKYETAGGLLFLIAGIGLLIFTHFTVLIIALPAFVIGGLFLANRYLWHN